MLDELARFAGIRVVEFNPLYMNLPHDSPCHGGFTPAKALAEADVGLLVDVDVPWIPSDMPDNPATWWAHIDVDAEKRNFPIWTFPGNLRMSGDSHRILSDLLAVLLLPYLLTPLYRGGHPVSTLMAWRWLTGAPMSRQWIDFNMISSSLPRSVVASEDAR